jgi:Pyruvate/2-oxoglutarate dehydrogenase complex, dihydrolipoamide acyltransferase (E2) component, and related enzymes
MIVDIVMPKMGESITEGTILEWRKKVGDPVEKDELFLEIGTDKVDSEIPCVESGIIVEILAEVNEVVEVGKVIAKIETDQLSTNQSQPKDETAEPKTEPVLETSEPPEIQSDLSETQLSNKIEKPSIKIKDSDKFFTRAVMKTARENIFLKMSLMGFRNWT